MWPSGARLVVLGLTLLTTTGAQANTASVKFMITNQDKDDLALLGYSVRDIATLAPERAAAIIDRRIRRPGQGVPASWTRGGGGKRLGIFGKTFGAVRKAATFSLAAALALHFSGMNLGEFSSFVDDLVRVLQDSLKTR